MGRRFDRILTGLALFLSGSVLAGLGFAGLKELAIQVGTWSQRGRRSVFVSQGYILELPAGVDRAELSVVLEDGTLDPRRPIRRAEWRSGLEGGGTNPPAAFVDWREALDRAEMVAKSRDDYRFRGTWESWASERWLLSPSRGILRCDPAGKFLGSLTDEGFVPGRRAPSSFHRATQWDPPPFTVYDFFRGPFSREEPDRRRHIVHYVTPDALYRADLNVPSIARLMPLDGARVLLQVSPLHGRVYLFRKEKVSWLDLADPSRRGGLDLPASVRAETYEFAEGSGGRLLFRARDLHAPSVRFRVAVCNAEGKVEREFEYDFAAAGVRVLDPLSAWRPPSEPTLDNLAGICAPVLWRAVVHVPPGLLERFRYHPRDNEFGSLWVSAILSGLLAVLVASRARGHFRTWIGPAAWALFVLGAGIPGFLTWLFLGGRERAALCACGRRLSTGFPACPRCGQRAGPPAPLGIEILVPIKPIEASAQN